MKNRLKTTYQEISSPDNLLLAWQEFIIGKRNKLDVIEFSLNLADNIIQLHNDLANFFYQHGSYEDFFVTDPKLRHIHKASVRDRLLHHAVYRQLYPYFANRFIAHSYSCQLGKGTHGALRALRKAAAKIGRNDTKTVWVLQVDIKKFFASIDHEILLKILDVYISDKNIIQLLKNVIYSFNDKPGQGLPLGNLTSQLLVNIYMNEFDQFVKRSLGVKYYIRYADDFVFFSTDRSYLVKLIPLIRGFLDSQLRLEIHPQKFFLKTLASGVDFLGWVHFPAYQVLRTKTKKRMFNKIKYEACQESLQSYLGLLKHGHTFKLQQALKNTHWLCIDV